MTKLSGKCKYMMWFLTVLTVVFGIMTIKSGGQVLFGAQEYRSQAGHYVPFVLWFNFIAGFFYILAGIGLTLQNRYSVILPWLIASATLVIFGFFGYHIFNGGLFENQTVVAMSLRSGIWLFVSFFVYNKFFRKKRPE